MEPPRHSSLVSRIISLDSAISLKLHSLHLLPRSLLKFLEFTGDGRVFFPILFSLLFSPFQFDTSLLINMLVGGVLDLILVGTIKHLVKRPRPVYNKDMFLTFAVDHWSFPSGHSSRVCFVASFLFLSSAAVIEGITQLRAAHIEFVVKLLDLIGANEAQAANYVILIACLWAAATSISRVLLGRHFVSDVTAGACLGAINALIVFHFINFSVLKSHFLHLKS